MLRGGAEAGADHGADDQRDGRLAAEHVAHLGCLVRDLIQADAQEADEHQLDNRAHARRGRADARSDKRRFGDRRIAYAVTTELVDQSLGDAQHATPRVKLGRIIALRGASDVFAHQEHARIAAHLQA